VLRPEGEGRRKTSKTCKESFSPGLWSPRTQQPNMRLSPPPARRDYHHGAGTADLPYPTTSLVARSRTPSPSRCNARSPAPQYYGTANLTDRSRSPSPENSREGGAPAPPGPSVRRTGRPAGERRRRRRRRQGEPMPVGQMPRVLPSPTVTPHHSPDRINFPRLYSSPSTSPPWSPAALDRRSFDLPGGEPRGHSDHGHGSRSRPLADPPRRHSHHVDRETGSRPRTTRRLHRNPSESATAPSGTPSGGLRTSNTWTGHYRHSQYDPSTRNPENNDDDDESESDGEGWC